MNHLKKQISWHRRCVGLLFLASILVVQSAETSGGSDFMVKTWGLDEGMPVASVTDVAQTPNGYLWIGTMRGGLVRFDGSQFVSFLGLKTVLNLSVDHEGTLWICQQHEDLITWTHNGFKEAGTHLGVQRRLLWSAPGQVVFLNNDGRILWGTKQQNAWQWQFITLTNVSRSPVLCADNAGCVWYLTRDQKLCTWQNGQFHNFVSVPGLEGQQIFALTTDSRGRVWAGTEHSLACWQAGQFVNMTPTNGEPNLNVKRICPVGSHGLWVDANDRMRRCEGRTWVAESQAWVKKLGRYSSFKFSQVDTRDGLWMERYNSGLVHLALDGSVETLTIHDGLASDTVPFVFPDRDGNIWTGHLRGELEQIHPRLFQVIDSAQGLRDTLVTTVCEDKSGAIWMGTVSGTVARYLDGQCTNYTLKGDINLRNSSVVSDARGRIWVGTYNSGLFGFENGQFRQVLNSRQVGGNIRLLFSARDGRLWIGTFGSSVVVLGDDGIKRFSQDLAKSDHPSAVAETSDGTIWLGTLGGDLLRWNGKQFEPVEFPEASKLGRIWSLCPTKDDGLWIATSEVGLLCWRKGGFRHYTTSDGLPSNTIMQLLTDQHENLWLATSVGLVRIAREEFSRFDSGEQSALSCSVYNRDDGLQTIGAMADFQPDCCRAHDGTLLFAMVKGVAVVDPDEAHPISLPPAETIEEVLANGKSVWPTNVGQVAESLVLSRTSVGSAREAVVRLGPGTSSLEIHYTGLSVASPQNVRFRCRLGNLDKDWVEQGNSRVVVYRAVPPGEYVFEVIACNRDGFWNDQPAKIRVVVIPHFYERKDFITAMLLAVVTGLVLWVRRVSRHRMMMRLNEAERRHQLELERTRIARDLHDDLGAGLTEISLIGSLAQRPEKSNQQMKEHLNHITNRAREMVLSMDEIVWALNPKHDSVLALEKYFREYAQLFLRAVPIACRLGTPDELCDHHLDSEQRRHLLLAFKEALNNVARHAQATEVQIAISTQAQWLIIQVMDDGRGLPKNLSASGADGLDNMSHRLESLGGSCQIHRRPEGGTCVRFELPLKPDGKMKTTGNSDGNLPGKEQ
jgi:signal transduction histidine kinase/ligand-binding sensor domain-containing protein